jgi:PTS system galactitol-specific IIB component
MTSGVYLIVTTTPLQGNLGLPVIQTLAFLTGMGKEAVIEQIIQALKL